MVGKETVVKLFATAIVASVAFAMPAAIETAYAQTQYPRSKQRVQQQPPRAYEVPTTGKRGYDPDPFIQGEILRHRNSGWPD